MVVRPLQGQDQGGLHPPDLQGGQPLRSVVLAKDHHRGRPDHRPCYGRLRRRGNPTWFAEPHIEILLLATRWVTVRSAAVSELADRRSLGRSSRSRWKACSAPPPRTGTVDAPCIIVNMSNYTIGADKGGQLFAAVTP